MDIKHSISATALLVTLCQTGPLEVAAAPQIVCRQPVYHFGDKSCREVISHTFVLENRGDQDLIIPKVDKTCGCTVLQLSTNRIAAGQHALMETTFDLRRRRGAQSKNFIIHSNDPKMPRLNVFLKGNVIPDIEAIPSTLFFGTAAKTEQPSRSFQLVFNDSAPYRITKVKTLKNRIVPAYQADPDGRAYLFTVHLAETTEPGRLDDQVRIYTDHPEEPVVIVEVKGYIAGESPTVTPPMLRLPKNNNRKLVRHLVLQAKGLPPASSIQVEVPFVHERVSITSQRDQAIKISLFGIDARTASTEQSLIIRTAPGQEGAIRVPIELTD